MIGTFVIMGKHTYIRVNTTGTLFKLPKLKWYYILYFAFKSMVKGNVHLSEVIEKSKGEVDE